ncbi:MAG: TFIIB-type zinc ribbon-containing protein [Nitrososphaeria archaeon]|jgi:uncharacterized Zn finger protein (UPF0148 family)
MDYTCPECGGPLFYETSTKMYICRKCGLYVNRQQLMDLIERKKPKAKQDPKREYLSWWLSGKS